MSSKKTKKKKQTKIKKLFEHLFYDFVKLTGFLPTLIMMRPKIVYLNKDNKPNIKGGFMVSANHCGFLDPVLVHCAFWKRRIYSLATKDLYSSKLKAWFFNHVHCIQVDKNNFSVNSFHEVTKQLKRGKVVSIFPEGEVNVDSPEVHTFKSGVTLMAHTANVPIVPIYLAPHTRWYKRYVIIVGEQIDTRKLCDGAPTVQDIDKISSYIQEKELELKNLYFKLYGENGNADNNNDSNIEEKKEILQ